MAFSSSALSTQHSHLPPVPRGEELTRRCRLPIVSRMAESTMTRDALAKRIAEVALLRGEFTLRSGRKSNYYLDKYRFETQPDVLAELGRMLADRVTVDTDRIAGAELGAVPLAAASATAPSSGPASRFTPAGTLAANICPSSRRMSGCVSKRYLSR